MTTFNIISIGDVEFLGNVLNSVAMVCGTGDFKQLCICGFIIGLLFIGFQCIFQGGQRINLQHTFTCFICYMLFFGPSCTVVVEDAGGSNYTRTVDNVPIGVGIAGTAISGIGYGVTHLMQQAFGTLDGNRNYGYIEPLKIVAGLRNAGYSDSIWSSLDAVCGAGCNTKESVMNYVNECTANAIRLGYKTPDEVYKADLRNNGISVIKFDSETLMTKLVIPADGGLVGDNHDGLVTCKEGFTLLQNNVFAKLKEPQIAFSVNQLLGIRELSDTGKSTPQDWAQINGAFATLGVSATDAQDWMLGTVVKPVYEQATIKNYRNFQDGQIAQTINTAITQRNVQWASEQTMFVSVCRAIMSFFEGFVYAITPIVGFMLMIGAFGLGLVGKYFMVLAWIQLWLPCMAICNMYTISGLRSELTTSPIGAAVSFYALDDSYQRVANWVSTGGMLFAATPMLALFVISGSMYAFTTLASRLQGQDHFNEKNIAPDVQQVGALQSVAPTQSYNRYAGALASGAEQIMPSAAAMTQMANAVSSAKTNMENETASLAAGFAKTGGTDASFGTNNSAINTIAQNVGSTQITSTSTLRDIAERVAKENGYDMSNINTVMTQFGAAARAGIGTGDENGPAQTDANGKAVPNSPMKWLDNLSKKGGFLGALAKAVGVEGGASISSETKNSDSAQSGETYSQSHNSGEGASRAASLQSNLANSFTAGVSSVSSDSWAEASRVTKNASMSKQFSNMSSTAKTYSESKSISDFMALSQGNRSLNTIAERLNNTAEGRQILDKLQGYSSNSSFSLDRKALIAKDTNSFAKMISNGTTPTHADMQKAQAMAAMNDMLNHGDFAQFAKVATATDLPSTRANEVNMQSPDYVKGATPGQTAVMRDKAAGDIAGHTATIEAGKSTVPEANYGDGAEIVSGLQTQRDGNVNNQAGANFGTVTSPHARTLLETLQKTKGEGVGVYLAKHGVTGLIRRVYDQKSPVQESENKSFIQSLKDLWNGKTSSMADFVSGHQQELVGLSKAQKEYMEASFNLKHNSNVEFNPEGFQKNVERAETARQNLKEEIKQHVFGDKYDAKRDEATLNKYLNGVTTQIEMLESNETQGYATKLMDFNRTFKVQTASGQKIS